MRTSHLNALRALEAVLRTGNFSAAAADLNVTPAAIGQQIRQLERYLGCHLFERRPSGARATPQAQGVKEKLSSSFGLLSGILDDLGRRQPTNRVAVTMPQSFAENWFVHRLTGFFKDAGGVDLRLDSTNRRVDLLAEDIDYAIRYSPPPPEMLCAIDLFGDWVLPVCTPSFAHIHALDESTRCLEGVPLIHLENRTPDPDWSDWPQWGAAFDFSPAGLGAGPSFMQFSSGLQAAIAGQGLVLAGLAEAWQALGDELLVAPFGKGRRVATSYRYRLVYPADRPRSPMRRRFERWIVQEATRFEREVAQRFGSL